MIALFACLAEDGWPVLVYPGSIDSIIEVAEGRFPALPVRLRALQFIALWIDAKNGADDRLYAYARESYEGAGS